MPQTIGNHGLYCPEFDDYAAVALYMQDLGTRIDDALGAQQDALEGFLNQPTIIITNPAAVLTAAIDARSDIYSSVLFNNAPTILSLALGTANGNVIRIGSPLGALPVVPYPRGLWRFGAICRQTATGAVTVDSSRKLELILNDYTLESADTSIRDIAYDFNTGGDEGQNAKHAGALLTGTHGVEIQHIISNLNAASTVNVLANGLMWVTYAGPQDIIEVA